MSQLATASGKPVSPARLASVRAATKAWLTQLQDLGVRNNLLFYKEQRSGTLDLSTLPATQIESLLQGQSVEVLASFDKAEVRREVLRRLRRIYAKAREQFEEQGVGTLHVALGLASWVSERTPVPPSAPVLLQPALLKPAGAAQASFNLQLTGEMEVNPILLRVLEVEFGGPLDMTTLAPRLDGPIDTPAEIDATLDWLRTAAAHVPGIVVRPGLVLANFNYAKLPMFKDLEAAGDLLAVHDTLAALAGDQPAIAGLRDRNRSIRMEPSRPDHVRPADEMLVLDADSSQSYVINSVLAGGNLVIKGPPGTGKSQTIANLIAVAIGHGKTVLFVAQKRAAIDAVTKRLRAKGLGDLLLDMHRIRTRREVAETLARSLALVRRASQPAPDDGKERLLGARARLVDHVAAIHSVRDPWGVSVYQSRLRCFETPAAARSEDRLSLETLTRLHEATFRSDRSEMQALADLDPFGEATLESPWQRLRGLTPDSAQRAFETVSQIRGRKLGHCLDLLGELASALGMEPLRTVAAWGELLDMLAAVDLANRVFGPEFFGPEPGEVAGLQVGLDPRFNLEAVRPTDRRQESLLDRWQAEFPSLFNRPIRHAGTELLNAFDPKLGGWRYLRARLFDAGYREARRHVRGRLLMPMTSDQRAAEVLAGAIHAARYWVAAGARGGPRIPAVQYDRAQLAFDALCEEMVGLRAVLDHPGASGADDPGAAASEPAPFETLDVAVLQAGLDRLVEERGVLLRLPRIADHVQALRAHGWGPLLDRLASERAPAELLVPSSDFVWHRSILDRVEATDARLATFDPQLQTAAVTEFRAADGLELERNPLLIRRAYAERAVAAMDRFPAEAYAIAHQASLKRGHLPLRSLFAQAPNMMLAVKPAWVMSPLMVSQWLPLDQGLFDIVVFDEASQVQPADGVPAIMRGSQLVVAGDDKQLPPTTFFVSQALSDEVDEDRLIDELASASGFESILDAVSPILDTSMLRWHYRSRDEALIAFSNDHFYDGDLTTFPNSSGQSYLRHVVVDGASGRLVRAGVQAHGNRELSTPAEVDEVVKLVLEAAETRPTESLGVIALGIEHAEAIADALRLALSDRPELDSFFDEAAAEPFFVKNLERVQGDERDAMILSIGYGKSGDGRLSYRFGPLNIEGGERRLNVAITRARLRMTVVSSFAASEMESGRTRSRGARLLHDYLEYVDQVEAAGGRVHQPATPSALSPLERDVLTTLAASGIRVVPRLGSSGHVIDFGALHPSGDGRFVLAIELDGPSYGAIPTARDRDRLRAEQLARLGWSFHRIWTEWWLADKQAAAAEVKRAFDDAVAAADRPVVPPASGQPAATLDGEPAAPDSGTTAPDSELAPVRGAEEAPPDRGPCPITKKRRLFSYDPEQLVSLANWIEADGKSRSEYQLARDMLRQLGYKTASKKRALYEAIFAARKPRWPGPYKAYAKPADPPHDIYDLVDWVESDGLLRSMDQVAAEVGQESGGVGRTNKWLSQVVRDARKRRAKRAQEAARRH